MTYMKVAVRLRRETRLHDGVFLHVLHNEFLYKVIGNDFPCFFHFYTPFPFPRCARRELRFAVLPTHFHMAYYALEKRGMSMF